MRDLKKWLTEECPASEIKYIDEEAKKGAYIPIGIIEQNLDEFDSWRTEEWSFAMMRVDKGWVASGSIKLTVVFDGNVVSRHGSTTFPIATKMSNDDFEGTALSLAIANAAKKLGKRFGRHLNGRLEKGDQLPVIDLESQRKLDAAIDEVNGCKSEEDIKSLFDKYPQYQKVREFVVAISNMKQILKIKSASDAK